MRYNEKADVFSFSYVLLEIVLSNSYWVKDNFSRRFGWRPPIPLKLDEAAPDLVALLSDCWAADFRERRPAFSAICTRLELLRVGASKLTPIEDIVRGRTGGAILEDQ